MISRNFNDAWCFCYGAPNNWDTLVEDMPKGYVVLPHDAMILEHRTPDTANASHTGYYPGNVYTYTKSFEVPVDWKEKEVFLEFDGVYNNAMVYINDDLAVQRPYGYSQFSVRTNDFLKYGQMNEIKVIANTGMEKNSRWYTGGGIYRNVKLYVANPLHVGLKGLRITTPEIDSDYAQVMVDVSIKNADRNRQTATVVFEIVDTEGQVVNCEKVKCTAYADETVHLRRRLDINNPKLWSCETPYLYQCILRMEQEGTVVDEAASTFGVRKLQLDVKHGLRINGILTNLRGACIHHDNGVIGAVSLARAEERKIRQLKEVGFNCIRSSHNPASPALLEVCDKYGMLVMDETFDIWTHTKCDNDYANHFTEWWERDIEAMVEKDYNHPCVILYSVGNEIDEAGSSRGAYLNRKLVDKIRSMDDTRYITNGINGMSIIMDQLDEIIPQIIEKVNEQKTEEDSQGDDAGSNRLNNLISFAGGVTGDMLFSHPLIGERTEEIYGTMDIAGMNYMTSRYELDHATYPNRIILGTETFPADIARLWSLVKKHLHVIGDMTWTGYDYLGEAGCGIFRYDGSENFGAKWPARAAYIGDINLIGNRRPISFFREIVYGLRKEPYIAVERLERYGQEVTKTPWMLYDDIESWTWPGYEGKPAIVRVFSASEEVELFLNGKSFGRKKTAEVADFTAEFEINYEPGNLLVVGFTNNLEDGRMELKSASDHLQLHAEVDRAAIAADGADLSYVTISLVDEAGIINPAVTRAITVSVEGAGALQGYGSANPESEGNYFDTTWDTFEGRVLAVIRSTNTPGEILVRISSEGLKGIEVKIQSVS